MSPLLCCRGPAQRSHRAKPRRRQFRAEPKSVRDSYCNEPRPCILAAYSSGGTKKNKKKKKKKKQQDHQMVVNVNVNVYRSPQIDYRSPQVSPPGLKHQSGVC